MAKKEEITEPINIMDQKDEPKAEPKTEPKSEPFNKIDLSGVTGLLSDVRDSIKELNKSLKPKAEPEPIKEEPKAPPKKEEFKFDEFMEGKF